MNTPVLRGPNWKLPFNIHSDASNYAIKEVLSQKDQNETHYDIYCINKNLVVQFNFNFN